MRPIVHSLALRLCLAILVPVIAAAAATRWAPSLALPAIGVAGFVALAGAFAAVLGPLRRLRHHAERAERNATLARLPGDPSPELGPVHDAFNRLLVRLTDREAAAVEQARDLAREQAVRQQSLLVEEANRRLEVRLRELSLLFDITRSLSSTLELSELLRRLTELVGATLGFARFAILLLDPRREELVVRASWGYAPGENPEGERVPISTDGYDEAMATGEYVLRRAVDGGRRDSARSQLVVPMRFKDESIGILRFSRPEVDGFSSDEINLLGSIAGQAALAIANARLYEQTVALSITDPLTGLHNRRHLFDRLAMELGRCERYGDELTVAMIDIDHFKQLNDTSGHAVGDVVLREVADVLRSNVRRVDTVARFGGEEFCVVLPRLKRAEALEVAEKLRLAVHQLDSAATFGQPGGRLTVSIGTATWPHDAGDALSLLDAADGALYASKREGRDRSTLYAPGMELHPKRKRQLTADDEIAAELHRPVIASAGA